GGSMFRVHRDVRFSPDKSPYKTHAAARFAHTAGRDIHAPVYYFHLAPGEIFLAAGLWHPEPETLAKIRDTIVKQPQKWKRAVSDAAFKSHWDLGDGDKLTRPPKGYDPEHPMIEDLKRRSFAAGAELSEAEACSPQF